MEITEVIYPRKRPELRRWLQRHHRSRTEVWVRRPRKSSALPAISYDELVEECLCFGWIDGVVKKFDAQSSVQRITPRRSKGSRLSELNRQRIWKLQRLGLMTPAGLEPVAGQIGSPDDPFEIPDWIEQALKKDPVAWKNFKNFPRCYQRLKVRWIADTTGGRLAEEVARQRLDHLVRMSARGKRYGVEPMADFDV